MSLARAGDEVALRREPRNPRDPAATEIVLTTREERLGYVPRPYTELVAGLLDAGAELRARIVRKLGMSETCDRWTVQIERTPSPQLGSTEASSAASSSSPSSASG